MNLTDFIKLRASEPLNTDICELWMDDDFQGWRDNQVVIPADKVLTKREAACLVGLSVFIHAEHYNDAVAKNFAELQKSAEYILVAVTDFGEDLGFEYRKELQ